MRKATIGIVALCGLASLAGRGADPEPPSGAKVELAKLKGTWTVTRTILGGRERKAPGLTYAFDGDKLTHTTSLGQGEKYWTRTYKVKIDAKERPYKIEMVPEGKEKGQVGIYKVEKGVLYLALGRGSQVPADFSGKEAQVHVMKKEEGKK